MYGTWKRLNAVVDSTKATSTQSAEAKGARPAGTANVSVKNTGRLRAPMSMRVRREPVRCRMRSLSEPMSGSMMTSHSLARLTMSPPARAVMPSESVM